MEEREQDQKHSSSCSLNKKRQLFIKEKQQRQRTTPAGETPDLQLWRCSCHESSCRSLQRASGRRVLFSQFHTKSPFSRVAMAALLFCCTPPSEECAGPDASLMWKEKVAESCVVPSMPQTGSSLPVGCSWRTVIEFIHSSVPRGRCPAGH